jgi:hypothetical protein
LLFRQGNNECIITLQQWLLIHILIGRDFDIVDLFICEIEDAIMDGMIVRRHQPFAHWISWKCAQVNGNQHMHELERSRTRFKEYSPTGPHDGCRGPRGLRRAEQILMQMIETEAGADPMAAETDLQLQRLVFQLTLPQTQRTWRMTRTSLPLYQSNDHRAPHNQTKGKWMLNTKKNGHWR